MPKKTKATRVLDKDDRTPLISVDDEWFACLQWKIAKLRASGCTQKALAEKIGYGADAISRAVKHRYTTKGVTEALARELGMPPPVLELKPDDDLSWIVVGRMLRQRAPKRFEYVLNLAQDLLRVPGEDPQNLRIGSETD